MALETIELRPQRTEYLTGWLCCNMDGSVAFWAGRRREIQIREGWWTGSLHGNWRDLGSYKKFDSPAPGKCRHVRIEVLA